MTNYDNFYYIYPPRPKNAIDPKHLKTWDDNSMICQIKTNGSNAVIFLDGKDCYIYNRHGARLTNVEINREEILSLYSGTGWMVINGEYLNKSKKDENNQTFNHKLIIFDILVYNSQYLVGKTFGERIELLDELFGTKDSEKEYLFGISQNVYRVKSYQKDFKQIFDKFTPIDVVEGVVLKRKNARLELGSTELNNSKSQLKSRKPTKNYKF